MKGKFLAERAYLVFAGFQAQGNLDIRKTRALCFKKKFASGRNRRRAQGNLDIQNFLDAADKRPVYTRIFVDAVNGPLFLQRGINRKNPQVGRVFERVLDIPKNPGMAGNPRSSRIAHSNRFLQSFLEGLSECKSLSDRLHPGTDMPVCVLEFPHIPARNLQREIVERRFRTDLCAAGQGVLDFGK
jgi:hypothetical protein